MIAALLCDYWVLLERTAFLRGAAPNPGIFGGMARIRVAGNVGSLGNQPRGLFRECGQRKAGAGPRGENRLWKNLRKDRAALGAKSTEPPTTSLRRFDRVSLDEVASPQSLSPFPRCFQAATAVIATQLQSLLSVIPATERSSARRYRVPRCLAE